MQSMKLRFQVRWNQTPRVPPTTVLGHSFYVAALTLLMCYDLNINKERRYNNFFSALFHDLPEAVTRDIISPVKQATDHLPAVVKEIEERIVKDELLPLTVADSYDAMTSTRSYRGRMSQAAVREEIAREAI